MTLARRNILSGLLGALAGCSPAALLNTTVSRKGFALEADIPYGPDPRQKLDLYRPETPRADGKAVIFFYGGSGVRLQVPLSVRGPGVRCQRADGGRA